MALSTSEADRQIKNLMEFLFLEAQEKAEEVRQKANAEYESQFQEMKRDVEKKLADEFKSKREQHKVEKLIKASQERQKALFSVMEFRNAKMQELKQAVVSKLANVEKNPHYPALMRNLIVQGLFRIQEEKVTVRVRKCDVEIAKGVLAEASKIFKDAVSKATGGYVPELAPLTIDTTFLPPAYSEDNNDEYCSGGVVLVARRGKILCKNTLDARLETAFHKLTPNLRVMLFGERAPPANAHTGETKEGH